MKITPIVFAAALAIFLTTIAASKYVPAQISETKKVLDFNGIDTLEIKSKATAKIQIIDSASSWVSFDSDSEYYRNTQGAAISAIKAANKMTITTDIESYRELNLVIPTMVKTLIVYDADIDAHDSAETINLQVSNSLAWQGDVKNIRITDLRDYSNPEKACVSDIVITSGAIDNLFIGTKKGMVKLKALDQIKAVTLQVGPNASLSISPISSMGKVRLQDFHGAASLPENGGNKSDGEYEYACQDN